MRHSREAFSTGTFPDSFENSLDTRAPEQGAKHIEVWERTNEEARFSEKEIVVVVNPEGLSRDYFLQVTRTTASLNGRCSNGLKHISAMSRKIMLYRSNKGQSNPPCGGELLPSWVGVKNTVEKRGNWVFVYGAEVCPKCWHAKAMSLMLTMRSP